MTYHTLTSSRLDQLFSQAEKQGTCLSCLPPRDLNAIKRRLAQGEIVRPFKGMYARADYWDGMLRQDQARHIITALSQAHTTWVFSHTSAALMHNLEVPYEICLPIHYITQQSGKNTTDKLLKHHHQSDFAALKKGTVQVTSIEQTIIDCAATNPFELALPIVDSALHQGATNSRRLAKCLARNAKRRGIRKARRAIKLADSRPDNGGESRVRAIMIECGLPMPELQAPIPNPEAPGHYYYADFLFTLQDHTKVAMELDGQAKYQAQSANAERSAIQAMMAERQREAAITAQGIRVVRFSYRDACNRKFLLKRLSHYGIVPNNNRHATS